MPQLESEPEHCFVCGAPATRRIKGDWYCSKHTPYRVHFAEGKKAFEEGEPCDLCKTGRVFWSQKEHSWVCDNIKCYHGREKEPLVSARGRISQKVWQIRNERLRELPMDCRIAIIEEIVKADVRLCIQEHGIHDEICQSLAEESGDMEEYLLSKGNPGQLPIYKIKGKFYFRDERLGEYRNIKDPQDRRTIDSVDNRDLEKPTVEDTKKVFGKGE